MYPHTPIVNNARCPKRANLAMGVYGEILHLLSNQIEIRLRVRLKPSCDRGEFEWGGPSLMLLELVVQPFYLCMKHCGRCIIVYL